MVPSVLYFGDDLLGSTSLHRANALSRLGCEVTIINPYAFLAGSNRLQNFLCYKTGYRFIQSHILKELKINIAKIKKTPDVIWINSGELFGIHALQWLRETYASKLILYQNDDPMGCRDGGRFLTLQTSLICYNLCVVVRPETALEFLAMGAQQVLRVFMSYDEEDHKPLEIVLRQPPERVVSFIGTMILGEHRDRFLVRLVQEGLPLRLIGNLWHKSSLWPVLQTIYEGCGRSGTAYSQAIANTAITLGLLSHQNRDLITTRSLEIPACAGLLCGERTSEHQLLYEDNHESVFWEGIEECISQCTELLRDPQLRNQISDNGLRHVRKIGVGNQDVCRHILSLVDELPLQSSMAR